MSRDQAPVAVDSRQSSSTRLDNFWKDREIIYNFRAEIYGINFSALLRNKIFCKCFYPGSFTDVYRQFRHPNWLFVYL